MKILHEEKQAMFNYTWRIAMAIMSVGILFLVYYDLEPKQQGKTGIWLLVGTTLLLANVLMWKLYFHLIITPFEVKYYYPPIINSWRSIKKESIEFYTIEEYSWHKFGGWGIRYSVFNGSWAYTVFNRHVLLLKRFNKKPLYLGTSEPKEAEEAMKKMMNRADG